MPATADHTKPSRRIPFIDMVRGVAVLLMVAVHTTDAFLAVPFRRGWLWSQIDILFGFVAPAFILLSGITFYIALLRRRESGRSRSDLVLRALMVLGLGYWLHIPSHSLAHALKATPAQEFIFFNCDVLHLIGLSMLLLLAVMLPVRDPGRIALPALGVGVILAFATPLIWNMEFVQTLPLPVRLYFASIGSFPIFPYAAYFLVGFGGAAFLLEAESKPFGSLGVIGLGIGLVMASYLLQLLFASAPPFDNFWQGSPALFLFRLGGIVVLTGVVQLLGGRGGRSRLLEGMGQASLGIYVLHLMLVYGSPVTMGMAFWFNGLLYRALAPIQTLLLFVAVAVLAWFAVDGWHRFRRKYPAWGTRLAWGWWIGFGLMFLATGW